MSNRHYWPEPPKEGGVVHLVEHKSGSRTWWNLRPDGKWVDSEKGELLDNAEMRINGYLGVLKPFSEEAERAAFEEHFKGCDFERFDTGNYVNPLVSAMWQGWLAAKRHEGGL